MAYEQDNSVDNNAILENLKKMGILIPSTGDRASTSPVAPPAAIPEPAPAPAPVIPQAPAAPVSAPNMSPFEQEEQRAGKRLGELEHERETPWGSPTNHPGTLGKIGHVLSEVGQAAAIPFGGAGILATIPGTHMHNLMETQQERGALGEAAGGAERQAAANKANTPAEKYSWHYQDDQGNEFGVRPDGSVEKMSEPGKKTKETPEKNFQQVQYTGPDGKNRVGFIDPEHKLWTDEDAKAGTIDPTTGQAAVAGEPRTIGHALGKTATSKETATTLITPDGKKVPGKIDSKGNLLTADDKAAPQGTMIYHAPTYGEIMAPTRTQTFLDPDTGIATVYQWNPETQAYDKKGGIAGTGQYAGRSEQAAAVMRVGNDLITDIQNNAKQIDKSKLGEWVDYVKKYGLDSPIADPTLARLQSEFMSFAALNPAMHGYRSVDAMHAFESMVGGLQKNPEAAIASIRGILQTAGEFVPPSAYKKTGGGGTEKGDIVLEKGPDGKLHAKQAETK